MKEIQVIPLKSAISFNLGWTREQTIKKLGIPDKTWDKADYYQKVLPMFSIHYDVDNRVEFISISNPYQEKIKIMFQGFDVFGTPANELIELIERNTNLSYDRNDPELEYSYTFPEVELSFWRPVLPESTEAPDGKYFETIGIGIKGYYSE